MEELIQRCSWATTDLYKEYHDNEWGVPSHDDSYMFEMLILEGFQAGLSWITILNKRENFRKAFDNFENIRSMTATGIFKVVEPIKFSYLY